MSRAAGPSAGGRAIRIHSLDQALAAAAVAAELGQDLVLVSAWGAASYAGPGWFAAIGEMVAEKFPDLRLTMILDCADETGAALAALRRGIKAIRYDGQGPARARLAAFAAAQGAIIDTEDRPILDLLDERDPAAACWKWLARQAASPLP